MEEYVGCSCSELSDGSLLAENVKTPHGIAESIYFGVGGIYIIVSDVEDPSAMYHFFRELFGAARVKLYVKGNGEYNVSLDSFIAEQDSDEHLDAIYDYLHKQPEQYSASALERMKNAAVQTDAKERGYYLSEDGTLYIYRKGFFHKASDTDPEHIFKLCLYGGFIGAHRFALGKWFSGIIYLLTCGFFLAGWLSDLINLYLGSMKDRRKNLVRPLPSRKKTLPYLPIGIAAGFVALFVWTQILSGLNGLTTNVLQSSGSGIVEILSEITPPNAG